MNFYKIIIAAMGIVIILLLLQNGCRKSPSCPEVTKQTATTTVTPHEVKGSDTTKPVAAKSERPTKPLPPTVLPPVIIQVPDSATSKTLHHLLDSLQTAYNELYATYTTQNEFYDGVDLVDSTTGKSYGFVYIADTIAANNFLGRSKKYELHFADTTREITKTIAQARFKVLVGAGLYGTQKDLFNQYELNLGIQGKRNLIIVAGAGKQQGNSDWIYSIHVFKNISFK